MVKLYFGRVAAPIYSAGKCVKRLLRHPHTFLVCRFHEFNDQTNTFPGHGFALSEAVSNLFNGVATAMVFKNNIASFDGVIFTSKVDHAFQELCSMTGVLWNRFGHTSMVFIESR
jgi:hypothetical protein